MFETFDIWYDDNLVSEDGRPFVIERLKMTDARHVEWNMISFTVEEAKKICEYIQDQICLHEKKS